MRYIKDWFIASVKYYSLTRSLVLQDIHGRFVGSFAGVLWTVVTPLANMMIYVFVFSVVMKIRIPIEEVGTSNFAIYLLSGLLPWMAFSEAILRSTSILIEKAHIITKVFFPAEILPLVCTLAPYILNGIGFLLLLLYLSWLGYFQMVWALLPVIGALFVLFTIGLAAVLSAIAVFVRDIQQLMVVVINLWMYLTPIIYPVSLVPESYRKWLLLNPVYSFIALFRQILLQQTYSSTTLLIAFCWATTSFIAGGYIFMRMKHAFGDVL